MIECRPDIHCVDFWPNGIPPTHIGAYKAMMAAGQILNEHTTMNKSTGAVLVEYRSTVPHEWIREEMNKLTEVQP